MTISRYLIHSSLILILGIGLGILSKWLDGYPDLPVFMERLDITNFLGRLTVWLVIAICIAVFSNSVSRAAVNVLLFFAGMVVSYYLYSKFVAGFFPRSYAMIWFGLTIVSPIFAAILWYAKGKGWIAAILSGAVIGGLAWTAVHVDFTYISITSVLDVVMIGIGIAVLWRRNVKELLSMLGIGILTLIALQNIMPVLLFCLS